MLLDPIAIVRLLVPDVYNECQVRINVVLQCVVLQKPALSVHIKPRVSLSADKASSLKQRAP